MDSTVTSEYRTYLVAISFALAFIGSFIALMITRRIRQKNGSVNWSAALTSGVALGGIGVWAMHFMGMVALNLNVASSYGIVETAVSLVAAIACTSVALIIVSKRPQDLIRMLGGGLLLGLGVVGMHYLGMFGMKFGGYIVWDFKIVATSILIAVVAATAALWLAFNTRQLVPRIFAALVMAVAVCAMHYTGMSAAQFVCTTSNRLAAVQGSQLVSSIGLSSMVAYGAFAMATLIALDLCMQWMQRSVYGKDIQTA
ncbi:MAG: MHYT domain-containing protein [Rhodoferax sp.]|jgi:NO-binding membrane sensor protein with MHYT domain